MRPLSQECALDSLDCALCAKDGCGCRCHRIQRLSKLVVMDQKTFEEKVRQTIEAKLERYDDR